MKASEQQALIPQEATPDTLIDLIGKTQQVTKAAAVVLKACRNVMDTKNKQEHIDKWGGIHAITEAVYDCADLAQRSLDMEETGMTGRVDPDTGEID